MGYAIESLQMLRGMTARHGASCSILDIGYQELHAEPDSRVIPVLADFLGADHAVEGELARISQLSRPIRIAEFFRHSRHRYAALDLYAGEFVIEADLNIYTVPATHKGTFDIVTNFGTTEHVADQINAFRVIHDFAKAGAEIVHQVPFCGYFNHGLFNYHPLFFVFMAHANEYEIVSLNLSPPHLEYTIPAIAGLQGCKEWSDAVAKSGIVGCLFRKTVDKPFRLFTDFDQAEMGRMQLPEPWASMVRDRYDLRVRR